MYGVYSETLKVHHLARSIPMMIYGVNSQLLPIAASTPANYLPIAHGVQGLYSHPEMYRRHSTSNLNAEDCNVLRHLNTGRNDFPAMILVMGHISNDVQYDSLANIFERKGI